jgi:hypothetical protein
MGTMFETTCKPVPKATLVDASALLRDALLFVLPDPLPPYYAGRGDDGEPLRDWHTMFCVAGRRARIYLPDSTPTDVATQIGLALPKIGRIGAAPCGEWKIVEPVPLGGTDWITETPASPGNVYYKPSHRKHRDTFLRRAASGFTKLNARAGLPPIVDIRIALTTETGRRRNEPNRRVPPETFHVILRYAEPPAVRPFLGNPHFGLGWLTPVGVS